MIIDCIADLHGHYPTLEGGNLLIVAGDLTARDTMNDWLDFETWICNQNYKEKIIIAGNHDNFLQSMDEHRMWKYWDKAGLTYLSDSGREFTYWPPLSPGIEGIIERKTYKIWGTPWTKTFPGMNPKCKAFTCDTEEELAEKWALIPDDTDILITHGPPYDIFDETLYEEKVGSKTLLTKSLEVAPRLHVYGHIHEQGGKQLIFKRPGYGSENNTIYVNASHVNEHYQPVNKPVRIIL